MNLQCWALSMKINKSSANFLLFHCTMVVQKSSKCEREIDRQAAVMCSQVSLTGDGTSDSSEQFMPAVWLVSTHF